MTRFIIFVICLMMALPAFAAEAVPEKQAKPAQSRPLLYTRDTLTIQRKPEVLPWQERPVAQPAPESGITFDVEVRDAEIYYNQKDWFNLSGPTDDSGVLLLFTSPSQSPIIASKQYAPLDILFIDAQGNITQIVPDILLSTLTQQIVPKNPVLAFLFLKGGICQNFNIKPGDVVEYKAFNKLPVVLGDPVSIIQPPPKPQPLPMPPKGNLPMPRKVLMPDSSPSPRPGAKLAPQLPPLPPMHSINNPPTTSTQEDPEMERALEKALSEHEPPHGSHTPTAQ